MGDRGIDSNDQIHRRQQRRGLGEVGQRGAMIDQLREIGHCPAVGATDSGLDDMTGDIMARPSNGASRASGTDRFRSSACWVRPDQARPTRIFCQGPSASGPFGDQ